MPSVENSFSIKFASFKGEMVPVSLPHSIVVGSIPHSENCSSVDSGKILTGGGVSLCIDTVLYVLEKNFGKQKVSEISRIMEYSFARAANHANFPTIVI